MNYSSIQQGERRLIVGVLPDVDTAKHVVTELRARGISDDRIGMALRQPDSEGTSTGAAATPAAVDTSTGAVGGGVIGGLAGLLAATGVVAIPGLGPLLAGGALASVLGATGASVVAGAGIGATAGGLAGGLISINVPEAAARRYDEAVRQGHVLMTVHADGDATWIESLLTQYGGSLGGPT